MSRARAGFTLVELLIVLALLVVVIIKLTIVVDDASQAHRKESSAMALEDQAYRVLDRISFALIGADPSTLVPDNPFPFSNTEVKFQVSMGVEDGEVVWGDPEMISLDEDAPSRLFWAQNYEDEFNERLVVWCNTVSENLENEVINGVDDNDNGLTDEDGLSFVIDRDAVTIRLTLERPNKEGEPTLRTVSTTVTCRN